VNALFADSTEFNSGAAASQAPAIARAAHCVVGSLLNGGKVLCCGNGASAADAQYLAVALQHRFERERPGLPALVLNADAAILSAIAASSGFDAAYATQVGVLGHPGDVLVVLHACGKADSLGQAVTAAGDRQLQVIALTGLDSEALTTRLRDSDIEIRAPTSQAARILENHRLVIHCLCDLIDLQLMGG
jgi:phosphoheptose isomerase